MHQKIKNITLAALLACGLPAVAATPVQFKFEGLSQTIEVDGAKETRNVLVDDFYQAGGSSKELDQPGTPVVNGTEDLGTVFVGPAVAISASDAGIGGDGNFRTTRWLLTSPDPVESSALGAGAVFADGALNTAASFSLLSANVFDTAVSFFYTGAVNVTIRSALGATLGQATFPQVIPPTDVDCGADPANAGCVWAVGAIEFFGDATSVEFSGTAFGFLLDNITLGSGDPLSPVDPGVPAIPEPSTYALMALGLAAVGYTARRRKQRG